MSDEKELLPCRVCGIKVQITCGKEYPCTTNPQTLAMEEALRAMRYITDLVDATLPELKIGGSAKAYNIYNDAVADSYAAIASLTKALGR